MTLKEMIDKYGFGVKFTLVKTVNKYWFIPIGITMNGNYAIGESSCELAQHCELFSKEWKLYDEPKPKKKLKLCTYVHYFVDKNGKIYSVVSDMHFLEETPAKDYKFLTTVKFAETEVEADDETT